MGSATSSSTGMATYTRSSAHMASASSSDPLSITNSRVIDHMTGMSSAFKTYKKSYHGGIRIANKNYTPVVGEGPVDISKHLALPSVLHALHFAHNLVSVGTLTKSHNCSDTIFPSFCVF